MFFVTTEFPWPAHSGGTIKTSRLIDYFSRAYDLELYCFRTAQQESDVAAQSKKYAWPHLFVQELEVPRTALNYVKSLLQGATLNSFRRKSSQMAGAIRERITEDDILFIDHLEMVQYVPETFRGRIIYHSHNAEYLLWKKSADFTDGWVKKQVLNFEAARVRKLEIRALNKADIIFAAPNDQRILQRLSPKARFSTTYHLGDDSLLSKPAIEFRETEKIVFYAGSLQWEPNVDALLWFMREVWPLVHAVEPDARLVIAGKDPDPRIMQASRKANNVELVGFVQDLDTWYSKSRATINPQRYGSGMKVKTSEALYRGMPLVTTKTGAEGYDIENGKEAFITREAKEFAAAVVLLLRDAKSWAKMRNAMRQLAKSKYTYPDVLRQMELAMK